MTAFSNMTDEANAALNQAKEKYIWKWYDFVMKMTHETPSHLNDIDEKEFWYVLSNNTSGLVTWDFVVKNHKRPWCWIAISKNPSIVTSWDKVANNLNFPWDFSSLSMLPCLTYDIVQNNLQTPRKCPNPLSILGWDWDRLSKNPSVASWELITEHARQPITPSSFCPEWKASALLQNPNVVRDMSYICAIEMGALGRYSPSTFSITSFLGNPAIINPQTFARARSISLPPLSLPIDKTCDLLSNPSLTWDMFKHIVSAYWDPFALYKDDIKVSWEDIKPFFTHKTEPVSNFCVHMLALSCLFPSWDYVVDRGITEYFETRHYEHLSINKSIVRSGEFVMNNAENRKYPWDYMSMTSVISFPRALELEVLSKVVRVWHAQNVICRQIERSLVDPSYSMCQQRVMREYAAFCNEVGEA